MGNGGVGVTAWLLAMFISLSPLSVHVNIAKGFEPLSLKLRVALQRSTQNRSLCVGYVNSDSGEETQSCRSLDGEHEPVTFWYEWKNRGAGRYTVYAIVQREAQKQLKAVTIVEILSTQ